MPDFPSLPYSSNTFAPSWLIIPSNVERRRRSNHGFIATREYTNYVLYHDRGGKSSNKIIAGWRDPSNYSRRQAISTREKSCDLIISSTEYLKNSDLHQSIALAAWNRVAPSGGTPVPWFDGINATDAPDLSSFLIKNLIRMSEVKALNDIAGAKANLGEFMATIRQSADMFATRAIKLLRYIRKFKSGRFLKDIFDYSPARTYAEVASGRLPKRIADAWLEFHYGWKPLAQDVWGMSDLILQQLAENKPLFVHGRGKGFESSAGSLTCPTRLNSAAATGVAFSCEAKVGVKTVLSAYVDPDAVGRLANQAGLINPASLAWELVPYSFVLDWIVPIGSFLSALQAPVGLKFRGGTTTIRYYRRVEGQSLPDSSMDGKSQAKFVTEISGFTRTKLASFPTPVPYVKPFYTGGDRWATIASLLVNIQQQFRR